MADHDVHHLDFRKLLQHAHLGVVIHRWDTSIVYANPAALQLLRLSYDQIIGKDAYDPEWRFVDDGCKTLLVEDYPVNKVIRSKEPLVDEVIGVIDSSSEDVSWFTINAYPEGEVGQQNSFVIVTFNEVSDAKKLFSFQQILENTQDVVIVTEAADIESPTGPKIVYVNKAFEALTGYSSDEVINETPRILQGTLTDNQARKRIHAALEKRQPVSETILNYDRKGRPYWIEMNIIPLTNKYGDVTHFAAIERDVSERKFYLEQLEKRNCELRNLKQSLEQIISDRTLDLQRAKAQLEHIAFFDPLTAAPNRRHFEEHAHRLMKFSSRRNLNVAFGLIDIDDFKQLNDTHGHEAGDLALIAIAKFLEQFFRADDAYCRYGGEEFAFAIAVQNSDDVKPLVERLLQGIHSLNNSEDASITRLPCDLSVSIGIQVCNPDNDTKLYEQLKHADQLMYQAKRAGKNGYVIASA